jgi:hypothetical protein
MSAPSLKRVIEYLGSLAIGIPLALLVLTMTGVGVVILVWLIGYGGIFQVLGTIINTAEAGFKHDWKMSEVVLVLLILFLMVRKR